MADRTDTFYAGNTPIGYGGQLLVGDGASPEVFQAVAFVRRVKIGQTTTATTDITHLRSIGAHREKSPGMRDSAAWEVEGWYHPEDESQSNAGGGSGSFTGGGITALHVARSIHNFAVRYSTEQFGSPNIELPVRGFIDTLDLGEVSIDNPQAFNFTIMPVQDASSTLP